MGLGPLLVEFVANSVSNLSVTEYHGPHESNDISCLPFRPIAQNVF